MLIQDFVTLARLSELNGVAAKDDDAAVAAFMNMGILELYTRFPLVVEEHVVDLVEDQLEYPMPDDFMYATAVHGEAPEGYKDAMRKLPINDEDCPDSVFFVDWKTLLVPAAIDDSYVSVLYVAKPTPLTAAQIATGTDELPIPDGLVDALLSYVGYRGHIGIRGAAPSENDAHWARFERNAQKAEEYGVAYPQDSSAMTLRLHNRGFV